ncbi:MAG TPA: amidohydrolase family protein [Candidatus Saccharimonadales bacterium]|nr:amidohydrolase family protein [Candidatus Saccharimonadales bacterium]
MIVDVHCHTPSHRDLVPPDEMVVNTAWRPDRAVAATTTWADYARDVEGAGVDVSLVYLLAAGREATGLPVDPARINDQTAEFVAANPSHRIGFTSVHPDDPGAIKELERSTGDLGLKGIKLGPNYQNFDPLSPSAFRLYGHAETHRLPIVFHQGTSPMRTAPLRYAHPLVMDEIAIRFPELRIVMAHLGHPWQADTITVIRKHPHVYADVSAAIYRSWSFYSAMRLATEWGVLEKLLFGSDYPIATSGETLTGLRGLNDIPRRTGLPEIPEAAIEAIIERDSLALLGLERPAGLAHRMIAAS